LLFYKNCNKLLSFSVPTKITTQYCVVNYFLWVRSWCMKVFYLAFVTFCGWFRDIKEDYPGRVDVEILISRPPRAVQLAAAAGVEGMGGNRSGECGNLKYLNASLIRTPTPSLGCRLTNHSQMLSR
jgi:hypothetical protein